MGQPVFPKVVTESRGGLRGDSMSRSSWLGTQREVATDTRRFRCGADESGATPGS